MTVKVIAAARLRDGAALWRGPGGWVDRIDAACVFDEKSAVIELTRITRELPQGAPRTRIPVIDVREVTVEMRESGPQPQAALERMRVQGPSVRTDLGKQSGDFGNRPPASVASSPAAHPAHAGIYRYDDVDRQFLRDRAERFHHQVRRRLAGELTEEEFRPLRLMNGLYLQLHSYMLRVAIPYGVLSSAQLRRLAYVARTYDRGYGHFTTRQNIQFNWVRLADAPAILTALAAVDMHAIQTSGNCVRNVTTDQFAGAARDEIVDPRLFAEILRQWSTDHPEFTYLPRKFKIAITGSPIDRAAVRVHDIGILAKRNDAGETGFEVYVGGGLGRTPLIGKKVRDWLAIPDFLRYIEAILRVYNALGRRDNIYKARIKILVRDLAPANFIRMIEEEFARLPAGYAVLDSHVLQAIGARFVPPPLAAAVDGTAFIAARRAEPDFNAWARTNTHPHRQPGYLCATISLKPARGIPGDASADEMDIVAGLAERFSMGEIRVSHEQNLILPHVRQDEVQALWRSLRTHGLATANVGLLTDIVSCPGLDYCSLAMARSIPIAQRIAARFAGTQRERDIGALDLNISGCVNACGHHHVGHLGLLGVDKGGAEFYQITLGGSADENAAIGSILGPAVAAADIVECIDAILGTFQRLRVGQERFVDAVRRLGLAPFKEAAYGAR